MFYLIQIYLVDKLINIYFSYQSHRNDLYLKYRNIIFLFKIQINQYFKY